MNPPTITDAPLGILATASSTETAFIGDSEIAWHLQARDRRWNGAGIKL
jgi:hypothetical protein